MFCAGFSDLLLKTHLRFFALLLRVDVYNLFEFVLRLSRPSITKANLIDSLCAWLNTDKAKGASRIVRDAL